MGPFHGVQSFMNRLLQHGSPTGSQVLPANLVQRGRLSLHGSTGPARSLLQCRLAMGSQHPSAISTGSSVGSSMDCRRISAPAHGPLPPPLSSLALVSAEFFLSHSLTPLSSCRCTGAFFPLLNYVIPEALPLFANGLSFGQWLVHLSHLALALSDMGDAAESFLQKLPWQPPLLPKPCHTNPVHPPTQLLSVNVTLHVTDNARVP